MKSGKGAVGWTRLIAWVFAATGTAFGGDFCCTAPKCWQFHRDVCFGHYQTRWRKWEDACGQPMRIVAVSPAVPAVPAVPAAGIAFHEARKPAPEQKAPVPTEVPSSSPRSSQRPLASAYVKTKERSTPPAVFLPASPPGLADSAEATKPIR